MKGRLAQTVQSKPYLRMTQKTKVIGVWDDNDFGLNDGGASFAGKDQNRELFLDAIGEPASSERRL